MNAKHLASALVGLMAAGCAAPIADEAPVTSTTAEALTLAQCATQRDDCFRRYPFFGLFTCPAQYAQCSATASNGIPAQVTAAIGDAAECASQARSCRGDAGTNAGALLVCTREEAECVGAIIDASIPDVVTDTAECVEDAVECIAAAKTVNALASCAAELEVCSVDVLVEVLPPAVGEVVGDVAECTQHLDACNSDSSSPSELTACAEAYIVCVGDGLGVTLENPPISEALACAEDAADCTFDATSLNQIGQCADGYLECTTDLVRMQLTCEQKFTQCMAQNPFGFLACSFQLLTCQD
jgi:hypothetical protein